MTVSEGKHFENDRCSYRQGRHPPSMLLFSRLFSPVFQTYCNLLSCLYHPLLVGLLIINFDKCRLVSASSYGGMILHVLEASTFSRHSSLLFRYFYCLRLVFVYLLHTFSCRRFYHITTAVYWQTLCSSVAR